MKNSKIVNDLIKELIKHNYVKLSLLKNADQLYYNLYQSELEYEYPLQDDQWPSRRWIKDKAEYIDLSGYSFPFSPHINPFTEDNKHII